MKHEEELTQKQIERQDEVDNAIYALFNELLKPQGIKIKWDIATIGNVRDAIIEEVAKQLHYTGEKKGQFEMAFYPYIEE